MTQIATVEKLLPCLLYTSDVAAAGEEILLQGVADCVFETTAGLTVVDFKTDRVTAAEPVFYFVFFTNHMASIAKSIVKKTEGALYPSRCITRTT